MAAPPPGADVQDGISPPPQGSPSRRTGEPSGSPVGYLLLENGERLANRAGAACLDCLGE
jgi:hypothetical protein